MTIFRRAVDTTASGRSPAADAARWVKLGIERRAATTRRHVTTSRSVSRHREYQRLGRRFLSRLRSRGKEGTEGAAPVFRRLKIALRHLRMRDDHRVAEPGDLQLNEAGARIDLALGEHVGDGPAHAADGDLFNMFYMCNRDTRRPPLQVARLALRRRAPRLDAQGPFRCGGRPGGGETLRGLGHGRDTRAGGSKPKD
ncbi:MAG: hypothetical protein ABSC25_26175 [Roseiarcus sp.]